MHPIQKKLNELSQTHDLRALGLRQIARMIGETHPQKVKHHMQKLGILPPASGTRASAAQSRLISIPLLGLANCGVAAVYADAQSSEVLQVSKRILPAVAGNFFALQAVGDSMNTANISGNSIEDGDYVIIDPSQKNFENGDYVVSIINGLANIKKFTKDSGSKQVVLLSESTKKYPPIYIHPEDMAYYQTSGKVVAVLKAPNSNDLVYVDRD